MLFIYKYNYYVYVIYIYIIIMYMLFNFIYKKIMMGCNLCDDDIDVVWFHPICVDKVHNTTF